MKAANVAALVVVLVAEMARRVDCPISDAAEALRPMDAMREALRSWEFNSPEARVEDMVDRYAKRRRLQRSSGQKLGLLGRAQIN